jgi:hypothetical protein
MSDIETLINQVANQDFSKAGPLFSELLQAKVTDALDAERIKLADQIYNGTTEDEDQEEEDTEEVTEEDSDDEESEEDEEEEEQ